MIFEDVYISGGHHAPERHFYGSFFYGWCVPESQSGAGSFHVTKLQSSVLFYCLDHVMILLASTSD